MPDSGPVYKITRADELNGVGAQLFNKSEIEAARLHFLAALSLEPNHAQALQNLGACLRVLQHYPAAASVARRSVVASNNNAYCRSNLAVSLLNLRQHEDALEMAKGVVADLPDQPGSWHNYALILYIMGRYSEALPAFDRALQFNPDNYQIKSDRSLTLLSMGRIAEGLASYESRWHLLHRNKVWSMNIPEWQGQALRGEHVLVHHEQGFGDSIMLSRFLLQLQQKDCFVTLAVPHELRRLFSKSFPDIRVIAMDEIEEQSIEFDFHSPLLSTARWLGWNSINDIKPMPYLIPLADGNRRFNLPQRKVKIGLCWASGNHGPALAERRRAVDVTQFLPITELPDVAVISLQKDESARDLIGNGLEGIIFDPTGMVEDFADTASIIAELDLVISVDSAVAHLAGALGKPCYMLSPYSRCWRWWDESNGLPWYNNMEQYHQAADGSWTYSVGAVIRDVAEFVYNRKVYE